MKSGIGNKTPNMINISYIAHFDTYHAGNYNDRNYDYSTDSMHIHWVSGPRFDSEFAPFAEPPPMERSDKSGANSAHNFLD